ncbi:hypothetical protein G6L09_05670 [Agrobacterium rhizogenes]|nr:hypothetical protein [Rhizobium rhizogenes]NTH70046.1 hypothetical protein [Rhizobium rhizogenes]
MTLLDYVAAGLSGAAFLAGLRGAFLWWRSSKLSPDLWGGGTEPLVDQLRNMAIDSAILNAGKQAGKLNAAAAIWTALATLLGTVATLLPLAKQLLSVP